MHKNLAAKLICAYSKTLSNRQIKVETHWLINP